MRPRFEAGVIDCGEIPAFRYRGGVGAELRAGTLALKEFPAVNGSTDGETARWRSRVHLGIAVNLDQGLVGPVIRDADELTVASLSARMKAPAEKARAGGLAPDETSGSTFSISNMGMLDVESFTAIINPGESAILAASSAIRKPVVRGDAIVIRPMLKLTLSSDHRLIDGAATAIRAELTARELGETIHAHPTFSEAWMEAAHALRGESVHAPPRRR
jgi:pyruvate dehydrogenase E2 component (dihydrolipoamide acetyltransferase)